MTTDEKAAAFDALADALTNRWHDGWWSWWCCTPPGGCKRATREEAVADLVAWAEVVRSKRKATATRPSPSTSGPTPAPSRADGSP